MPLWLKNITRNILILTAPFPFWAAGNHGVKVITRTILILAVPISCRDVVLAISDNFEKNKHEMGSYTTARQFLRNVVAQMNLQRRFLAAV